jgi:A1 cistron-splicing factor AAR2
MAADWKSLPGEQVTRLAREACGTVVILDARAGAELGVDLRSWTLGPAFLGIKLVPPGVRLLHYRTRGAAGGAEQGASHGMLLAVQPGRTVALRWLAAADELVPVSEPEQAGVEAAVRSGELDARLGPYDLERFAEWQALSGCIDEAALARARIPLGVVVAPGGLAGDDPEPPLAGVRYASPRFLELPHVASLARELRARRASAEAAGAAAGAELDSGTAPWFLRNEEGAQLSAAEITAFQMDPSPLVERLLARSYGGALRGLLADTQLALLLFLYLSSLEGLEFWKGAVHLVCASEALRHHRGAEVAAFLASLQAQLGLLPPDLFKDELLEDNFLTEALASILGAADLAGDAASAARQLRATIAARFGQPLANHLAGLHDATENDFCIASIARSGALEAELASEHAETQVFEADVHDDDQDVVVNDSAEEQDSGQGPRTRPDSGIDLGAGGLHSGAPKTTARMAWMLGSEQ